MPPIDAQTTTDAVPEISVIVSTYGRAWMLPDLFAALAAQDMLGRFEVIVTDNGSPDDTWPVLQELAESAPFPVQLHRNAKSLGPGGGRNTGAATARGDILAFTDDDCQPQRAWLSEGVRAMSQAHRVVVGHVCPPEGTPAPRPNQRKVSVTNWTRFETANAFYRREDFERLGGFFSGFDQPSGEDLDLGMRAIALGIEAHYEPDAVVVHPVRTLDTRGAVREAARWTGVTLVMKRHPELRDTLLRKRWLWRPSHLWCVIGVGGVVAGRGRWWSWMAWAPWVRNMFRRHGANATTVKYMPQLALVDAVEVVTLLRTSIKNRIFIF